ncbi:TPA: DNA cytosine methyltransferase [Pasteurella multocida]|nr:DNA cytosine methyltransferase [Pasteurella multocida]
MLLLISSNYKNMYKVLDLFSGAGGMAEGFLQAGFSIPFASDLSIQAAQTYQNRHKQLGYEVKYFQGDINELKEPKILSEFLGDEFNHIDVVTGGPPCQGFSLAGKRDSNDVRNKLIHSYIEVLQQVRPKYFVMENVLGILSARAFKFEGIARTYENELITDILKSEFSAIGYSDVKFKLMDASLYGVPQKRQRVIFLGTRNDIPLKLSHPKANKDNVLISSQDAISDLEMIDIGQHLEKYTSKIKSFYQEQSRNGRTPSKKGFPIPSGKLMNYQTSMHTPKVIERFTLLKEGENIKSLLMRLSSSDVKRLMTKKNNCKKIVANQPSPTVLTLPDDLVHYNQNRILTVREMARLQSFDDSFEFLGKRTTGGDRRKCETPQYTLVGNAVPPLLAKAIADEIMRCLRSLDSIN